MRRAGLRTSSGVFDNIANANYEPGFKATPGLKDLRLASEAATDAGRTLPILAAVHRQMSQTLAAGMGAKDSSAMAKYTIESPPRAGPRAVSVFPAAPGLRL
ncbi:NAD-binding protein [Caballeronia sp. INDeC2]|uniref:NAD-binding protein n=1 Tax=Caballeronia sp. INDeC2 TaxID=2921747 RepID=UPI002027805F|nr:NAD-binding protein [Caballeronia sp. INDeC2]